MVKAGGKGLCFSGREILFDIFFLRREKNVGNLRRTPNVTHVGIDTRGKF